MALAPRGPDRRVALRRLRRPCLADELQEPRERPRGRGACTPCFACCRPQRLTVTVGALLEEVLEQRVVPGDEALPPPYALGLPAGGRTLAGEGGPEQLRVHVGEEQLRAHQEAPAIGLRLGGGEEVELGLGVGVEGEGAAATDGHRRDLVGQGLELVHVGAMFAANGAPGVDRFGRVGLVGVEVVGRIGISGFARHRAGGIIGGMWMLLLPSALALDCGEILGMLDAGVPTSIVATTLEAAGSTYDSDTIACLSGTPPEVRTAVAAHASPLPPAQEPPACPAPAPAAALPSRLAGAITACADTPDQLRVLAAACNDAGCSVTTTDDPRASRTCIRIPAFKVTTVPGADGSCRRLRPR